MSPFTACSSCAETMIDLGEDGEMELKAEYCGRVQCMNGDYEGHAEDEELVNSGGLTPFTNEMSPQRKEDTPCERELQFARVRLR
jgi:hypothetical protein